MSFPAERSAGKGIQKPRQCRVSEIPFPHANAEAFALVRDDKMCVFSRRENAAGGLLILVGTYVRWGVRPRGTRGEINFLKKNFLACVAPHACANALILLRTIPERVR